ncbi:AAA family ATPase [Nocardia brasiliensis]|uniref:AAA family ATPase n=1 Tax=Nocardia brasiliensis TaxID=37326 RepID=UPI0024574331|nr:AAA family ATPase [Nocardia brasiliensis]
MSVQLPPHDVWAERSLLGITIMHPDICGDAFQSVSPEDFYTPLHQDLAVVVSKMMRDRIPVDPTTVLGQVTAQGKGTRITGHWLLGLVQEAWSPHSAATLAETIRGHAGTRTVVHGLTRALQRLETVDAAFDPREDLRSMTAELRGFCDLAESIAAPVQERVPRGMGEFLSTPDTHDWLVPGMMERGERAVITGAEGGGKSVLVTQLATAMAGSLHPFTANLLGDGSHTIRVLVVDCENSAAQSRRRFRWMVDKVDEIREVRSAERVNWNEQMFIEIRPAGIDLLSTRDVSWLESCISATAPDLVVLGPLYKLHHENPNDESPARELAWVLDGLRDRHGFALLTEAHAGNATDMQGRRNMRPIGSSLWRRWPEYGFGLSRATDDPGKARAERVDVIAWRGSREERAWPSTLHHAHVLPWMPDVDYYADVESSF